MSLKFFDCDPLNVTPQKLFGSVVGRVDGIFAVQVDANGRFLIAMDDKLSIAPYEGIRILFKVNNFSFAFIVDKSLSIQTENDGFADN